MNKKHILFLLKLVHTLVFVFAIGSLIPVASYALTGQGLAAALWALLLPLGIFIGLQLNGGTCILQTWAKQLIGINEGWARDVFFLPESWAIRTVAVMVPVFFAVVGAAAVRWAVGGWLAA